MKQDVHFLIHDYFQDRGWLEQPHSTYGIASDYQPSLGEVLESEGGYSNDAGDPGGPTKYGITIFDARMYWKKNATAADVKAMPLSVAKDIYKAKYWDAVRGDDLPAGVDYSIFDYGVNSGVSRAAKVLQRLVHAPVDGKIGPGTVAQAVAFLDKARLINDINDERIAFLRGLHTWSRFGRGWAARVVKVRKLSLEMAKKAPAPIRPQPDVTQAPIRPQPEASPAPLKAPIASIPSMSPRAPTQLLWDGVKAVVSKLNKMSTKK